MQEILEEEGKIVWEQINFMEVDMCIRAVESAPLVRMRMGIHHDGLVH